MATKGDDRYKVISKTYIIFDKYHLHVAEYQLLHDPIDKYCEDCGDPQLEKERSKHFDFKGYLHSLYHNNLTLIDINTEVQQQQE